jgi:serine/threonine protein kinase
VGGVKDEPQDQREARADLRLGKLAVSKGLLTPEQLKDALEEQRLGVQRGRKRPRRLGVIFAAKHFLTDEQVLALLEEQEARLAAMDQRRAEDQLLGRILVDGGFSRAENVAHCLKIQEESILYGADEIPLLGSLLVEKGYATREAIEEALELQRGVPVVCSHCGDEVRVGGVEASDVCPKCQAPLEPEPEEETPPPAAAAPAPAPPPPPPPAPEPAPPPAPELQRLGRYQIVGKLGRGAMGEVYEALDPALNRKAALKVIRSELDGARGDDRKEVARFIQEAQLAAKLSKHPHIVSVYEADVAEGLHYIAMELIRGRTLAEWRKEGHLTVRQQVKILRTVALAVHYAHEHGVLHRDLKPANVLLDGEQKPYVTDFGLARAHDPGSDPNDPEARRVCGTPQYISPEQAQGLRGIDRRTDVYSLGVMLYEALEGHPPFKESSRAATLHKVIHDPVPTFSGGGRARAFTTSDPEIQKICLKALAKKPEERTPTAEAFAKELAQWLEKKSAGPGPTLEQTTVLWKRPQVRIGAVVAGVLLLVLVAAVAFPSSRKDPRPGLVQAEKLMKSGDHAAAYKLYDQAFRSDPSDAEAKAGREQAKGKLISAALADLDRAMGELDKARQQADQIARRPKPQTLDEEQHLVEDRRAAAEKVKKAEERVKACREQVQSFLGPSER